MARTLRRVLLLLLCCVPCIALGFVPRLASTYGHYHLPQTTVSIAPFSPIAVSRLVLGATHTEQDADAGPGHSLQAVGRARQLMQEAFSYQNQAIMGWGAGDPEPAPGVYGWQSLDARVQLMRSTHATMVLTLCCAPGWMRPEGYQDDWSHLEVAPDAEHVQDFADLARTVALRYPDVRYFQVWNEFKGMWGTSVGASADLANENRWDAERYTTLYNAVYDAIKSARPTAQVGGPYIEMVSDGSPEDMPMPGPSYSWGTFDQRVLDAITYWLLNKHGADFITVDGSSANDDGVWLTDAFSATRKFVDAYNWIRTQPGGGATLPIWWAEWYAGDPSPSRKSLDYDNALMAAAAIMTLKSQANVLLLWGPQGDAAGFSFPEGIWTSTAGRTGGRATPYYATAYALTHDFGPGTQLYKVTTTSSHVIVMASATRTMLVSRVSFPQEVIVNHIAFFLAPYQVIVINTP